MKETNKNERFKGSLAILGATFIWGFYYIVIRDSFDTINVHYLMSYRYIIAFLGMALVFAKNLKKVNGKIFVQGLLLGFLIYIAQFMQVIACGTTTIGKASFINALYVILIPLICALFLHKRINRNVIFSICIVIPGLYLLNSASGGFNIGDLMAFAGSLGFAIHIIFTDRFANDDNIILLSIMQYLGASIFSTIGLIISGEPFIMPGPWNISIVLKFLYLGLACTLIGFFLQMWGQKKVGPVLTSMLLTTEAIFATVLAYIILGEPISLKSAIGCILMLIAVIIAEL